MNEIVKYQNDLNTATMRTWTEAEMNVLFSIVAKIREKSTYSVEFSFDQIKELANKKKNVTKKEFVEDLISVSKKLGSLNYLERSENGMNAKLFILFQTFDIDGDNEMLSVEVHPKFEYVFNRIGMEFTSFELAEFVSIQSTYAKTAYRLLKQYRTTGWWKVSIEDFRALLAIPDSYKSGNIDQQILKPITKQLGGSGKDAIFKNLKIEKIKKSGRGRGGILTGYKFTFLPEEVGEWEEGKYIKDNNRGVPGKRKTRKESLPEWAKEGYVPPEEKPLSAEEQVKFDQRLEQFRSKMKDKKADME